MSGMQDEVELLYYPADGSAESELRGTFLGAESARRATAWPDEQAWEPDEFGWRLTAAASADAGRTDAPFKIKPIRRTPLH